MVMEISLETFILLTYHSDSGSTQTVNGFTFTLISVNGNNLVSTATIRPVNSGLITLQCANAGGGTNRSTAVVIPCKYNIMFHRIDVKKQHAFDN